MVAKLILAAAIVAVFMSAIVLGSYWYFDRQNEREHEKDLEQMEHTERVLHESSHGSSIDRELEREERR